MSTPDNDAVNAETPIDVQLEDVNGVKIEDKPKPIDLEKARASFQDRALQYLAEQVKPIILPSFAKWFSMNDIHEIEKHQFPDYFSTDNGKKSSYKNADSYKYMRDFMINCYRLNPIEYLTVTALRRSLSGDVTSIIRVHQFLEQWGLINYQIDPRTKPSTIGPQYTGHFQVILDTPKSLVPFVPEGVEIISESPKVKSESESLEQNHAVQNGNLPSPAPTDDFKTIPLNLEVRRNIFNDTKDKENANQYICNTTGKDTNDVRYHNLKSKDQPNLATTLNNANNISEECFEQGLFPSNFQSTDFLKFTKLNNANNWSEQEILLLLEAIEMFGTNDMITHDQHENVNQFNKNVNQWEKISQHVGTKTKEQCVLKFIQLPIEDGYLGKLVDEPKSEDKENIIQIIVNKVIKENEGVKLLKNNSVLKLEELNKDSANLIKQISELTLEKVNLKLGNLSKLEETLITIENNLNLQRRQLLIERWLQYEKIYKFKQNNTNPEINNLLDDLLTPVDLSEINSAFNRKIDLSDNVSKDNNDNTNNLPVSVTKPQAYKFWSG